MTCAKSGLDQLQQQGLEGPRAGSRLGQRCLAGGTLARWTMSLSPLSLLPLMGFSGSGVKTHWIGLEARKVSCPAARLEPFLLGLEVIIDGNNYSPIPSKAGFNSTKCSPLMNAESH